MGGGCTRTGGEPELARAACMPAAGQACIAQHALVCCCAKTMCCSFCCDRLLRPPCVAGLGPTAPGGLPSGSRAQRPSSGPARMMRRRAGSTLWRCRRAGQGGKVGAGRGRRRGGQGRQGSERSSLADRRTRPLQPQHAAPSLGSRSTRRPATLTIWDPALSPCWRPQSHHQTPVLKGGRVMMQEVGGGWAGGRFEGSPTTSNCLRYIAASWCASNQRSRVCLCRWPSTHQPAGAPPAGWRRTRGCPRAWHWRGRSPGPCCKTAAPGHSACLRGWLEEQGSAGGPVSRGEAAANGLAAGCRRSPAAIAAAQRHLRPRFPGLPLNAWFPSPFSSSPRDLDSSDISRSTSVTSTIRLCAARSLGSDDRADRRSRQEPERAGPE